MVRATPMTPVERRTALVEATLPLLYVHGRAVTTKQIAEAAGVAEGTIFRVFASKEELVDTAIRTAFTPGEIEARLADVDLGWSLEKRLVQMVSVFQQRLMANFGLMRACGMLAPPAPVSDLADRRAFQDRLTARLVALIEPDADQLTVSPHRLLHLLRLLTFSASHTEIADGDLLTPEEIVAVVLHGVSKDII